MIMIGEEMRFNVSIMVKVVMRHLLLVDSRDRDFSFHPSASRYVLRLPTEYRNVTAVRLRGAEVPNSFFAFSAALGNLSVGACLADGGGAQVGPVKAITLPEGSYDAATLAATLQALLNAAFPGSAFSVAVEGATGRLVTQVAAGKFAWVTSAPYASGAPNPKPWGLGYHLGFAPNAFLAGATVTSASVVVLSACDYILLSVAEFNGLTEAGVSGGIHRAFAKFPLFRRGRSAPSETLFCDDRTLAFNETKLSPPLHRLDRLTVGWHYHGIDAPVDFNGADHSFTLEIDADP